MGRQLEQSQVTTRNWGSVSVPNFSVSRLKVFANTSLCFRIYFTIASATVFPVGIIICALGHMQQDVFLLLLSCESLIPPTPLELLPVTLTPSLWGLEKNIFFSRPIQLGKNTWLFLEKIGVCMHEGSLILRLIVSCVEDTEPPQRCCTCHHPNSVLLGKRGPSLRTFSWYICQIGFPKMTQVHAAPAVLPTVFRALLGHLSTSLLAFVGISM